VKVPIFDDIKRTHLGPAANGADPFTHVNESAEPRYAAIRSLMEDFYSRYPTASANKLRSDLRGDGSFLHAYSELFTHELLLRLNFKVTIDPVTARGKTPDIFAVHENGLETYVEVKFTDGKSDDEKSVRAQWGRLDDVLNSIRSPYFFFDIGDRGDATRVPPPKEVKEVLQNRLRSLGETEANLHLALGTSESVILNDGGFEWEIELHPKTSGMRANPTFRNIAAWSGGARWGNNSEPLRNAVTKKARKYRNLEKPYIIAVNWLDEWGFGAEDIEEALYRAHGGAEPPIWHNGRNAHVSAVLVTVAYPWGVNGARMTLYHCPAALYPIYSHSWRIDTANFIDGKVTPSKGETAATLFQLTDNWPNYP
jgi:hypothetical protein